jgi:protein tyrosine/serine phosphatase
MGIEVVTQGIFRSEQPTPQMLVDFKAMGGHTVLRLNGGGEFAADDERASVEALDMEFIYVPLPGWLPPSKHQISNTVAVLEIPPYQPVLIHCQRGKDRTGLIVAIYRIQHGWTNQQALEEARAHGMSRLEVFMQEEIEDWKP